MKSKRHIAKKKKKKYLVTYYKMLYVLPEDLSNAWALVKSPKPEKENIPSSLSVGL